MRQIILDTETTGLEPEQGHRVIEIGAVELVNRRPTARHFHQYFQPDRPIDAAARDVHGISDEFLADKPRFADVADELLEFLAGAELVIHNAPFDVGFLNYELSLIDADLAPIESRCSVLDTLALARRLHPGQRNSLDALCKRYAVDNSQRTLHGALLDAEILAEVYLAMTGGQATLDLAAVSTRRAAPKTVDEGGRERRVPLKVLRASDDELAAHVARLAAIDEASEDGCLWLRLEGDAGPAGSA
ncbi:MAG: DNA polymerase III subunit epsilon [Gammaproteobacteria bacterium]|nr:DNA polymerase III subunit epsilon [Gammaproteobacteria bacterium]